MNIGEQAAVEARKYADQRADEVASREQWACYYNGYMAGFTFWGAQLIHWQEVMKVQRKDAPKIAEENIEDLI